MSAHDDTRPTIVIIGGGPRGISILERLGARLSAPGAAAQPLDIHVIDDVEPGAGRIWRTDQTREMCKNTLADAVTLFTDASVVMDGPVRPGPTLYEWCVLAHHAHAPSAASAARVARVDPAHRREFDEVPVRTELAADYADELGALDPTSHPSRALYGEYLRWCFARALAALPARATAHVHRARAVGIAQRTDAPSRRARDLVRLDTGTQIAADAVVAATGWLPRTRTRPERALATAVRAHPDLVWVEPDSPIDQPLELVPDGAPTLVRGLGMGFFDAMALLTLERGGRFVPDDDAAGGLRYEASGREPLLHVTSHRGLPFRAKTLYGSLPPRPAQRHLRAVDWPSTPRPIDFDTRVWPLIVKDAFADHIDTLARVRPAALAGTRDQAQSAITASDGTITGVFAAVAPFVPDPRDRFDLAAALQPVTGATDPESYQQAVIAYLRHDLAEAERGADSAFKAGLWSISSARAAASAIGAFGGFDAESRAGFHTLHSVGGMIGSGPPAFRNRQLLALVAAGLVRFVGPNARVRVEDGVFAAESPAVPGSRVRATALVDAWVRPHALEETADALTAALADAGRARAFRVRTRDGARWVRTGGVDVDPATGRLVTADGLLDPRVHVAGIPTEETQHDTLISPLPGANASMLRETDRVAASLLAVALSPTSARH